MISFLDFLQVYKDAFIAAGVLLAAITSTFGVWWSTRATLKNSVGSFRVNWNEELRDSIAEYVLLCGTIHIEHQVDAGIDRNEIRKDFRKIFLLRNKILLMLNQDEEEHKNLANLIIKMHALPVDQTRASEFSELSQKILEDASLVFRTEWRKVKRGDL